MQINTYTNQPVGFQCKKGFEPGHDGAKISELNLKSYIGSDQSEEVQLITPLQIPQLTIDVPKALEQAHANRKEDPQLKRKLLEAERNKTQAKCNNGLTANLNVAYGLTNTDDRIGHLLDHPETQKMA